MTVEWTFKEEHGAWWHEATLSGHTLTVGPSTEHMWTAAVDGERVGRRSSEDAARELAVRKATAMNKVTYREDVKHFGYTNVLLGGEVVARYRKRIENYSGIQGGGSYTYFDVYPLDVEFPRKENRIASDSTRKRAVTAALVHFGHDDAALALDRDHAGFQISKRSRL